MIKSLSFGHINLGVGESHPVAEPDPETPMRILLLGDWSRRAHSSSSAPTPLSRRTPVLIDRDNFDEVLARFGVAIHIASPNKEDNTTAIHFTSLDDFHPDQLVQRVEALKSLAELRAKLSNASTFSATAAEMGTWIAARTATEPAGAPSTTKPASPKPSAVSSDNLLDQILGEPPSTVPVTAHSSPAQDWKSYIQSIVELYVLPRVDYSKQAQLLALIDEAMSQHMRGILHNRDFQETEAAWRAVYFLVRRLETDTNLKLYLLDVSKNELANDLGAADDLRSSTTYRLLVDRETGTAGGQPWSILVGQYTFDHSQEEVELLGRIARIASRAGAPFLAAASPRILGCSSLAEALDSDDWQKQTGTDNDAAWAQLRQLPESAYLGLALPRFLLRQPYGKKSDPIERFQFEETVSASVHEDYLWGNPAAACTYLLAEGFSRNGWDFRPGAVEEIDGLPVHLYGEGAAAVMKPCAEVWLSNRSAETILDRGLMPLLSVKGRDAVRLGGLRSVASAASALAGPWRR